MTKPNAVLFDLDGCLVDSEPLSLQSLASEMQEVGVPGASYEMTRDHYLGWSLTDVSKDVTKRLGKPCPPDLSEKYHQRLFALYERDGLPLVDTMVALHDRLFEAGLVTAIASGGSPDRIVRSLNASGLMGRFEGRTYSGEEVERGKPAPDLFLYAARKLGLEPSTCVVVEDSPHGIEGAVAAGMRAFGFTGGSHLDGIRDQHRELLLSKGAEAVCENAMDLFDHIMGVAEDGSAKAREAMS
ncbi:haloacid dehalogenase superfamily, subfamily IA, variant 3 with third motif having DD or ED [Cohaesibacter sp. ES.047]|uniref:HAD family hydrolase n=1 Tax=Cohaesibacter sp. ES.047 TaxID=1798205 RepID=UPI000BB772CC|nr:HAD-IA family hydrolase [Cohaesibacter sp. ES.047]SNY92949.1 haloacid dehalogenase superfamily, subfamily IA, variant 3 with third motif having DD or ED [Cohaesibacter sp. ES.047]